MSLKFVFDLAFDILDQNSLSSALDDELPDLLSILEILMYLVKSYEHSNQFFVMF